MLTIPEGTQSGDTVKIRSAGVDTGRRLVSKGDMYVKLVVDIPKTLPKNRKRRLRQWVRV